MQRVEDTRVTLACRTGRSALVAAALVASALAAGPAAAAPPLDRAALAAEVKAQFVHAWSGYKRHAWGHDGLRPLSTTRRVWYGETLVMTPIDALDALILLGLENEAKRDHAYVVANASFDKDVSVKTFEITIRLLGGQTGAAREPITNPASPASRCGSFTASSPRSSTTVR